MVVAMAVVVLSCPGGSDHHLPLYGEDHRRGDLPGS